MGVLPHGIEYDSDFHQIKMAERQLKRTFGDARILVVYETPEGNVAYFTGFNDGKTSSTSSSQT